MPPKDQPRGCTVRRGERQSWLTKVGGHQFKGRAAGRGACAGRRTGRSCPGRVSGCDSESGRGQAGRGKGGCRAAWVGQGDDVASRRRVCPVSQGSGEKGDGWGLEDDVRRSYGCRSGADVGEKAVRGSEWPADARRSCRWAQTGAWPRKRVPDVGQFS